MRNLRQRTRACACLGMLLFTALSGTGCDGALGAAEQDTVTSKGQGRLRLPPLGISLEIPQGWSASPQPAPPLYLSLGRDSFSVFQPSLTVLSEAYPQAPDLGAVLRALEESKAGQAGSDIIVASRDTVFLDGIPAGVLEYGLRASGLDLRTRQFAVLRGGRLILITCMDTRAAFPASDGGFEAIVASIRFE